MQIVLNQRGNFLCPGNTCTQPTTPPTPTPAAATATAAPKVAPAPTNSNQSPIDLVLADLKKRGASRPRKVSTLTSTIKALLKQHQKPNADVEVANLIVELQKRAKVIVSDTKVSYKLA